MATNPDRTLKINVSGTIFVIKRDIIRKDIKTPLSSLSSQSPCFDVTEGAFCFSRDPDVFYSVLNYFRYGELHLPKSLCGNMIRKELEFWGIPEQSVSGCCSSLLCDETDTQNSEPSTVSPEVDSKTQILKPGGSNSTRTKTKEEMDVRTRIFWTLDDPNHSLFAMIWHIVYICIVLLYTCLFIVWNEEIVRVPSNKDKQTLIEDQQSRIEDKVHVDPKLHRFFNQDPALGVISIVILCNAFFTLEFLARFVVCPAKIVFIRCPRNVLNLALVVVTWFVIVVELTNDVTAPFSPFNIFYLFCTGLTSARLVLIFRISKMSSSFKRVFLAVKHSCVELFLLLLLFLTGVIIFGTMVYYVEMYHSEFYANIYESLWWSVVTLTTVGYGDMYPVTILGRIVGSVCGLYGVLLIVVAVAIVTVKYAELSDLMHASLI